MSDRPPPSSSDSDSVWTYRGYHLRPSEFSTAMVHLYRAEITRANVWRQRLDTTTNWAVVTTGAAVSIAFTNLETFADVILLNILLITMFLWIETRRYRYYELFSQRARLMETDFFAGMLVPPFRPSDDWAEGLAETLLHPQLPVSMLEALGRRVRRNYWWLFVAVLIAWLGKLYLHPQQAISFKQLISRAAIGSLSGWTVFIIVMVYISIFLLLGLFTIGMHESTGEILPRFIGEQGIDTGENISTWRKAWFRRTQRRRQLLALIITSQAETISQHIFKEMRRGATRLSAEGMFTHENRDLLLCALTVTEVNQLKSLINEADPSAFMIISPAQEIIGQGFKSFSKNKGN